VKLLLDTHTFIWWLANAPELSTAARNAICETDAEVSISAASIREICTKHRLGKLAGGAMIARDASACISGEGFHELPITVRHGQLAGNLQAVHADPFDRMLAAQAILEGLTLVSADKALDAFGVTRLW